MSKPLVRVVMGSKSDWEVMQHCVSTLEDLGIEAEVRVLSAHRTPEQAIEFSKSAEDAGVELIIAAAGGAAHLAGVIAAKTTLPVLGVPLEGWALKGLDALLSTAMMPGGIPVASFAIGKAGAKNAAYFAAAIMARKDENVRAALNEFRAAQTKQVAAIGDPREDA